MSILLRSALLIGSVVGIRRAARAIRDVDFDLNDALGVIGLARRPHPMERVLPTLGLVAVGALIGAGTALILAPSSGAKLRTRLSGSVDDLKHRLDDLGEKGKSALGNTPGMQSSPNSQTTHS